MGPLGCIRLEQAERAKQTVGQPTTILDLLFRVLGVQQYPIEQQFPSGAFPSSKRNRRR